MSPSPTRITTPSWKHLRDVARAKYYANADAILAALGLTVTDKADQ